MHIAIHLTKKAWHKVKEFWEFSLVGVTSFALMFFMTLAMTELTPLSYRWAYGLGLSSSYIYQFVLNMKLVFTVIDQPVLRIERFIVVAALMMFTNWALVVFVVEMMKANYIISILVINTILGLLNFKVQDVWVFRKIPESKHHKIEHHVLRKMHAQGMHKAAQQAQ